MLRLNGIVLSIATLLVAGPVLAGPNIVTPDPFEAFAPDFAFAQRRDLARFTTIGSPDGPLFASPAEETAAAINRVQSMMTDVNTGWPDVLEVRILTTSAVDQETVAALIANDPRLAGLPVSYRVVERLPADGAAMGIEVLVSSARAVATIGH